MNKAVDQKILIVEDSLSDSVDLQMKLETLSIQNVTTASTYSDGLKEIIEGHYNLVFLDLFLDGEDKGIELAETLTQIKVPFIVTTSFEDESYMERLIPFTPVAYLKKPVDTLALRFRIRTQGEKELYSPSQYFFYQKGKQYIRILIEDIRNVEGEGNYVTIYTDKENILLRHSLKALKARFPAGQFIQIHRNWLIRLQDIEKYDNEINQVQIGDQVFPVGRTYQSNLISELKANRC